MANITLLDHTLKLIKQSQAEERGRVASLVGRTIAAAEITFVNEGAISLRLDDGRVVTFSATGDDATMVTMGITEELRK